MKPLIALCVGHSRTINGKPEGGAVSVGKVSEWNYNRALAPLIAAELSARMIPSIIISRYEGTGYGSSQRQLAAKLKDLAATAAIELHFNSADTESASGHEWLYWHSSQHGKRLAGCIASEMCLSVPEVKSRGAKPRFPGDRGAEFLKSTHCPAIIAEPFFGSNQSDWNAAMTKRDCFARAIAEGVAEWLD
jgi:N-acetylmuramoyl-L-alanine amidase